MAHGSCWFRVNSILSIAAKSLCSSINGFAARVFRFITMTYFVLIGTFFRGVKLCSSTAHVASGDFDKKTNMVLTSSLLSSHFHHEDKL